jgi:hypothetical protein
MRAHGWIGAAVAVLTAVAPGRGAEPPCCEPPRDSFLQRVGPAGSWHPYGGGLLSWWPRDCFPCGGAPDDYCRKSLPRVCWPPYPPYYIWGPAETCPPQHTCRPASPEAH